MTKQIILVEHPKLKKPPIRGASFEMTFVSGRSAVEALPRLRENLGEIFPRAAQRWAHRLDEIGNTQDPTQSEIQATKVEPPPDQPQFKLYEKKDGNTLLFGTAFLKVIYVEDYSGWIEFLGLVKRILSEHLEAADVTGYSSLKLMYVNRVPWEQGAEDQVLQAWTLPSDPPLPELESVVFRQQTLMAQFPDGVQEILVSVPGVEEDSEELAIQFDITHSIEFGVPQSPDLDSVLEWLDSAHERIHQTFQHMLKPEYLEAIS